MAAAAWPKLKKNTNLYFITKSGQTKIKLSLIE